MKNEPNSRFQSELESAGQKLFSAFPDIEWVVRAIGQDKVGVVARMFGLCHAVVVARGPGESAEQVAAKGADALIEWFSGKAKAA